MKFHRQVVSCPNPAYDCQSRYIATGSRSAVLLIAVVLSVFLAGCDSSLQLSGSSDEAFDVFIPELDEEVGPLDDGLGADEPVFHIEGDYEIAAEALIAGEPKIGAALPASPVRKQEGVWTSVFNWPVSPIHMTLLPDDSVLTYGTNPDAQNATGFTFDKWYRSRGRGVDAHETTPTGIDTNLFCSAQTVLPDGNVLISGGDGNQVDDQTFKNDGIDATTLFDYQTNILFNGPAMHFPRWYPTLVTLPDGKQLVVGGRKFKNNSPAAATDEISIPPVPEVFDPGTGRWSLLGGAANQAFYNRVWYYPRSWLRHDGNVIIADTQSDKLFELSVNGRGSLTELGEYRGSFGGVNTPAAMFRPGKILFVARNKQAEVLDISGESITVEPTSPSNISRNWGDATILANGEVFLSGGIYTGASNNSGDYPGEIWNPDTGEWKLTAKAAKARLYHSTTMLLPNGRVLAAGGGPPGPVVNMNAEIFIPPYLFDANGTLAERPEIVQLGAVNYGLNFNLEVSGNTSVSKVSFIRASSVTHSFDQGQRYMELAYDQTGSLLEISAPSGPTIAPPGLYMLFVFNESGVPSQARLVMMDSNRSVPPTPPVDNTDPADTDPENLLSNGGFETNKAGWIDCSAAELSTVTAQSSQGDKALLQQAGACLYQEVPVTSGATYTLSCDAYVQDSAYSSININMLDGQYNELTEESATVASAGYQTYDQSLVAPEGAAVSAITLYSEGSTYFDSCRVVNADNDTDPVTPPPTITPPASNLLANSTFAQGKASWTDCAATQLTSIVASDSNTGTALKVENSGCIYQEFPVSAGKQYELQCDAKSEDAQYSSITLQISDQAYSPLDEVITVVAPGGYSNYRSAITAPSNSAVGAITLYSEDASHFEACYVSEIQ